MILEIFFSFYLFVLFLFSLSSHCLYYCVLLVLNSLIGSLICYILYGFSWYSLLLCLVYIGGVYILFIFVSIFNPNDSFIMYSSLNNFKLIIMFVISVLCLFFVFSMIDIDYSYYLCTSKEGSFYIFLCLMLLFGFIVLSMLFNIKMNFYR
uniref:NADH dehydrogenase subunit 6 n=1 Tax=Taenia twitchelli TaxID=529880 RepID=N0DQV7_9CEST|nr:NADH dehydrogenase subunit 6 [Taenia twitchelli]BAN15652.1 NADH dehydrogenase subunit 6 [Taenia twitchelli]